MKGALVGWLVAYLAVHLPAAAGDGRDSPSRAVAEPRAYKLKATLVSFDLAAMRVTFVDAGSGALRSASLTGTAVTQVVKLKSGQRVTLQCTGGAPSTELVVESIKKHSHKTLVILGLTLVLVVASFAFVASVGPI